MVKSGGEASCLHVAGTVYSDPVQLRLILFMHIEGELGEGNPSEIVESQFLYFSSIVEVIQCIPLFLWVKNLRISGVKIFTQGCLVSGIPGTRNLLVLAVFS